MKKSAVFLTVAALAVLRVAAADTPMELEFRRAWQGRFVFDQEIDFPEGVTFLPAAHYAAEIKSLPAAIRIETNDGKEIASYAAPTNVAPPFTMHLALTCLHRPAVFATKDGVTSLSRIDDLPKGFDPRPKDNLTRLRVRSDGGAGKVRATISAGVGQADVRFVTRGRENALYWEGGRLFFTFSARFYGACQAVASIDPRTLDIRYEGEILFDYGDGILRNDLAAHLFFDEEADGWRGWASNFSTGSNALSARAKGGLNAVWSKKAPLHGLNVMSAKSLNLDGMNEDPSGIWDPEAKKWRLLVSNFTKAGIRAMMLESDRWDGPFAPITGTVSEDSTGTTIQWMNGRRYCFVGSAAHALHVYSYPKLELLGKIKLQPKPWGDTALQTPWGVLRTGNSRVWPCFAELPDGYPQRYLLITMDRINVPGMPKPNWTYGGLHVYTAEK